VTDDGPLRAPHVVVATPINVAQALLRRAFGTARWCAPLLAMKTLSAATIQLELSRPAYPVDRTIFGPGTVLASFGEQSRTTFKHANGRLSVILSPPATFVGMQPLRPDQRTPVPGLALAGGYTKQPWIDTMEGAVISGRKAARAVLAR